MKSRYTAYTLSNADYIIKTTDVNNPDFTLNTQSWKNDILEFCRCSDFQELKILEFKDGENEAFVEFTVTLFINNKDASFTELSRFLKVSGQWKYIDGTVR